MLLAIQYVDKILQKSSHTLQKDILQLIGIASIILAVKVNENVIISMELGLLECDIQYTLDMLLNAEKAILIHNEFKVNEPTPIDFIQFLLHASNPEFDFGQMITDSLRYAFIGLLGMFLYTFV